MQLQCAASFTPARLGAPGGVRQRPGCACYNHQQQQQQQRPFHHQQQLQQQQQQQHARHRCHAVACSAAASSWGPSSAGPNNQGSSSSGSGGGVLDAALAGAAHMAAVVVGRLSDALQGVAPPGADRHKVETAVKGGLLLLALGLLKGVISFVLLVGCAALVAFTATQVFGWTALSLGRGGGDFNYTQQTYESTGGRAQQQQQQQQYRAPPGTPWQQQQQQYYQQQQPPPPGRGRGGSSGMQGDIVDVWPYGRQ